MSLTTYSKKQTGYSKRQQAAALLKAIAEYDPFGLWLKRITPTWTWDWNYQLYVRQYLTKITRGELKRLMLFMPPRHGKSEMVTIRYPVWRLLQDPSLRVIIGAYNQTLADKFSRKARKIAQQVGITLSRERTAVEDWETEEGGGLRAVGVGGGITGQGGDIIIMDDPVKSREEARSQTYRDKVYDWYTDDLYTRLEPGAAIVLIMTRWHEDDLAGRILASEDGPNWTVISLPAEAEVDDPLGRKIGEALCPDRYDLPVLQAIRKVLQRSYWALYQQRPQEQEGDIFKRSWFEIVREVPREAKRVRYWDRGATKDDGDYTVGTKIARTNEGIYYVEDVVRGQWSTGERNRIMKQTAELDGIEAEVWFEQEPGSSGVDVAQDLIKLFDGFIVHADKVTGDKSARADPFSAQCEGLNVKIKKAPWNEAWLDELTSFPNGAHDDQVDSASGAYNKLAVDTWWFS
jgi:predicted phage terminase large subunit-like protein